MTFRFWGVRGSLPCPAAPETVRAKISAILQRARPEDLVGPEAKERFMAQLPPDLFGLVGGNTTCAEFEADPGHLLVVDGGTGLRELGLWHEASSSDPKHYHILLTHFHWDHLQGIPFFPGLFRAENRVTFYSPTRGFESLVREQMRAPHFPVPLSSYPAQVAFVELGTGTFSVGGTSVCWAEVNHPGGCVGYRFNRNGKSLVFSTDTELRPSDFDQSGTNADFFRNLDVLIIDSQYTLEEFLDRVEWGHSPASLAVDFALDFGAQTLYLFHHEPDHTDSQLEAMGRTAQWYADHKRPNRLTVKVAREGSWEKVL